MSASIRHPECSTRGPGPRSIVNRSMIAYSKKMHEIAEQKLRLSAAAAADLKFAGRTRLQGSLLADRWATLQRIKRFHNLASPSEALWKYGRTDGPDVGDYVIRGRNGKQRDVSRGHGLSPSNSNAKQDGFLGSVTIRSNHKKKGDSAVQQSLPLIRTAWGSHDVKEGRRKRGDIIVESAAPRPPAPSPPDMEAPRDSRPSIQIVPFPPTEDYTSVYAGQQASPAAGAVVKQTDKSKNSQRQNKVTAKNNTAASNINAISKDNIMKHKREVTKSPNRTNTGAKTVSVTNNVAHSKVQDSEVGLSSVTQTVPAKGSSSLKTDNMRDNSVEPTSAKTLKVSGSKIKQGNMSKPRQAAPEAPRVRITSPKAPPATTVTSYKPPEDPPPPSPAGVSTRANLLTSFSLPAFPVSVEDSPDTLDAPAIKSVLKKSGAEPGAKKNVQFGPRMIKEVTKIVYPWNLESDSEVEDDTASLDSSLESISESSEATVPESDDD